MPGKVESMNRQGLQRVGRSIVHGRANRKMTQVQLAEELGVRQSTLSRWEQGQVIPADRYRRPLADAIGREVDDLFHPLYSAS